MKHFKKDQDHWILLNAKSNHPIFLEIFFWLFLEVDYFWSTTLIKFEQLIVVVASFGWQVKVHMILRNFGVYTWMHDIKNKKMNKLKLVCDIMEEHTSLLNMWFQEWKSNRHVMKWDCMFKIWLPC